MQQDNNINLKVPNRPVIYVRTTKEEYLKIALYAQSIRKSVSQVAKKMVLDKAKPLTPLISTDDLKAINLLLARMSNNMNQIARGLNAGHWLESTEQFVEMKEELQGLASFLFGKYGHRRQSKSDSDV